MTSLGMRALYVPDSVCVCLTVETLPLFSVSEMCSLRTEVE